MAGSGPACRWSPRVDRGAAFALRAASESARLLDELVLGLLLLGAGMTLVVAPLPPRCSIRSRQVGGAASGVNNAVTGRRSLLRGEFGAVAV